MTPDLHGAPGLELHAAPAVHMPQKPLASQTCPAPQVVPAAFGVPSVHVCAPVAHEVTPLRQAELGLVVQLPPEAQATHMPATLQTRSIPHEVPGALIASSMHTGAPVEHSTTPRRQALPGLVVHAAPALHATQLPAALQTWLLPHEAPAVAFMPSSQPGAAPQVVRPRLQGAPGFDPQAAFGTHCRQLPPTQTRSTPQPRPDGAGGPSMHTAVPESHRMTPVTQGVLGFPEQLVPSAQVMHTPALVHTRPGPHVVPAGRWRVEFEQVDIAPQTVSPSTHGSAFVVQGVPAVQVTQDPPRQTRFAPQATPLGPLGPSMHEAVPFWQRERPVRQGAPVFPMHGWLS